MQLQYLGLRQLVFTVFPRIECITAELEKDDRQIEFFIDVFPQAGKAFASVDVAAKQVQVRTKLRDQVDVLDVAVDDGERLSGRNRFTLFDHLVEKAV